MQSLNPKDIQIRKFELRDLEAIASYWYDNSEEFWRARGVDMVKRGSRADFVIRLQKVYAENADVQGICIIDYRGVAVGNHSLTNLVENESAIFHAHIWNEKHRHLGIGVYSYLKAADFLMQKLGLKKIIFKTPKINLAANRIKEKIGIPCLGDTVFDAPILAAPLPANLYELDASLLMELKKRHGI